MITSELTTEQLTLLISKGIKAFRDRVYCLPDTVNMSRTYNKVLPYPRGLDSRKVDGVNIFPHFDDIPPDRMEMHVDSLVYGRHSLIVYFSDFISH